jgi:RimJ/RimL family protein N-acetyltransferase
MFKQVELRLLFSKLKRWYVHVPHRIRNKNQQAGKMEKFGGLNTKRLKLRDFLEQDLTTFAAYRSDPDIARYQSWSTYDSDMAKVFFANQQALSFGEAGTWYQIAITHAETGELLGDCVIHFIDGDGQQVELGVTLAPSSHGHGYGYEALMALNDFIFNQLNKHRIVAFIDVKNSGAIALIERLGFRREAHFVENILFKGCWGSEYMFAMLKREWGM